LKFLFLRQRRGIREIRCVEVRYKAEDALALLLAELLGGLIRLRCGRWWSGVGRRDVVRLCGSRFGWRRIGSDLRAYIRSKKQETKNRR
jgi:hypothetical protein